MTRKEPTFASTEYANGGHFWSAAAGRGLYTVEYVPAVHNLQHFFRYHKGPPGSMRPCTYYAMPRGYRNVKAMLGAVQAFAHEKGIRHIV